MNGQIDLFAQMDEQERRSRAEVYAQKVRDGYRVWLTAPEHTPCDPDAIPDGIAYSGVHHICDTMPPDKYAWRNRFAVADGGGEFWVMGGKGISCGEVIRQCQYCGADLSKGEGQRYLSRAAGHVFSQLSYREYYRLDEVNDV